MTRSKQGENHKCVVNNLGNHRRNIKLKYTGKSRMIVSKSYTNFKKIGIQAESNGRNV